MSQLSSIKSTLSQLSGGALWYHGTSCDLESFVIRVIEPITREIQYYQLTINCAWRLRQHHQVVLSSDDYWFNDDNTIAFEPSVAAFWAKHNPANLIIWAIEVQPQSGDLCFSINHNYQLDILIDAAAGEHWVLHHDGLKICSYRS
ncbi:hypothetical protein [Herpetosiphon sp. NSE202]|uniref:hypothetical protein n=1 Tax=Herpetosiphon sp. NSE202 TaxID=3351349 RepID=UPI003637525D